MEFPSTTDRALHQEDFIGRHAGEILNLIDEISDERRFFRSFGDFWTRAARRMRADVSVIVSPAFTKGMVEVEYLVEGVMMEKLPARSRQAPNRCRVPSALEDCIFPSAAQVLSRDRMERHGYPSEAALEFYAGFSYCGWIDVPIREGGRTVGKVSFMRSAWERPHARLTPEEAEAVGAVASRWLLKQRVLALRQRVELADFPWEAAAGRETLIGRLNGILNWSELASGGRRQAETKALVRIRDLAASALQSTRHSVAFSAERARSRPWLTTLLRRIAERVRASGRGRCRFLALGRIPRLAEPAISFLQEAGDECVENALRCRASRIVIRIHGTSRHLYLTIADDGAAGPERATAARHLRRRAQRMPGVNARSMLARDRGAKSAVRIDSRAPGFSFAPMRVVVVDDHPAFHAGVVALLESEHGMEVVGSAANGASALRTLARHDADVVFLDLSLPDADGLALLGEIASRHAEVSVVVMAERASETVVRECIERGARGFLLKDGDREEIAEAVRGVRAGRTFLGRSAAALIGAGDNDLRLTCREMEVLRAVATGQSNKDIAASLNLQVGTVKSYLKGIFAKLGAGSRSQAIHEARQRGLLV